MNPVNIVSPYFFAINFDVILPSTPMAPKWPINFRVSDYNIVCIFRIFHASYGSTHLIFLHLIVLIFGEECKFWNCSLSSFLNFPATPSLQQLTRKQCYAVTFEKSAFDNTVRMTAPCHGTCTVKFTTPPTSPSTPAAGDFCAMYSRSDNVSCAQFTVSRHGYGVNCQC
jgi:hypothetical protein